MEETLKDKEQILKQLNDIHSCLIVSEKAVPYSKYTLFLWGGVSVLLFLSFEFIFLYFNLFYAILYVVCVVFISQVIEYYATIRENNKYDVSGMTIEQNFIRVVYSGSILFSIILTFIFVSNLLGHYSYPVWVFMLSFSNIIIGFILNNSAFKLVGSINIFMSIIMFAMFSFSDIAYYDLAIYIKYLSAIGMGLSFFYVASKSHT